MSTGLRGVELHLDEVIARVREESLNGGLEGLALIEVQLALRHLRNAQIAIHQVGIIEESGHGNTCGER